MGKHVKLITLVAGLLSLFFLCIGFASLQETLTVGGSLSLKVENTLVSGSSGNSIINSMITITPPEEPAITNVVFDNYNAQSDVIEGAGLSWEDGDDSIGRVPQKIKYFKVENTLYVLGEESNDVVFNEDSSGLFQGLEQLEYVYFNDSIFSQVEDLSYIFDGCSSLLALDWTSDPDTSNVLYIDGSFRGCKEINVFSLAIFEFPKLISMNSCFEGCTGTTRIDFSSCVTSGNLVAMESLFEGCESLTELNVTGLQTQNVVSMNAVFRGCSSLTEIVGVEGWDVSSVVDFTDTFAYCESLESLDLSAWSAPAVTKLAGTFGGCMKLTELDLYGFDASGVTDFSYLFSTRGSRDGDTPLDGAMALTTVWVPLAWNDSLSDSASGTDIFLGTEKIVGGEGYTFNDAELGSTRLGYDQFSNRGYLSLHAKDWGEPYTIYYHSFNESGADIVYETVTVYENREIVISGVPTDHADLSFLGWSPHGTWITDEQSDFYPNVASQVKYLDDPEYYPENRILHEGNKISLGKDLAVVIGSTYEATKQSGEIHLYDLYTEHYVLLVATDLTYNKPSTDFYVQTKEDSSSIATGQLFFRNYFWQHVLPDEDNEFYPKFTPGYKITELTRTHYVHPGLYIGLKGRIIDSGDYDYPTSLVINGTTYAAKATAYVPVGLSPITVTLKVSRSENSSGSGSGSGSGSSSGTCIASGTLITLADGRQVPVETLRGDEEVLVFNHETGKYEAKPILFFENDGEKEWTLINLRMSDGTHLRFIGEHGLFDLTENRYVYIDETNYRDYLGHEFAKAAPDGYTRATLTEAYLTSEVTGCYSFPTAYHLNFIADGFLSMPGGIAGLFNIFEYDEELKYDPEQMQRDIRTYGLFTYEDFKAYMSYEVYQTVFPMAYLKVALGKGNITWEGMEYIINRYLYGHDITAPTE